MRWLRWMSSCRSDEIRRMAAPCRQSCSICRQKSRRAPTSIRAVGSQRTKILRGRLKARPSTSFCWLPPENSCAGLSGSGGRISSTEIIDLTKLDKLPTFKKPQAVVTATLRGLPLIASSKPLTASSEKLAPCGDARAFGVALLNVRIDGRDKVDAYHLHLAEHP